MRSIASVCGVAAALAGASPTSAQSLAAAPGVTVQDTWRVTRERPRTVSDLLVQLNDAPAGVYDSGDLTPTVRWSRPGRADAVATRQDLRFEGADFSDRLRLQSRGRLRRADGAPLPPGPLDAAAFDAEQIDLTYTRGWTESLGRTEGGLDVTLTPHLGVGMGSRGGRTEAGATLKIGPDLDKLVPDGQDAFGDRPRWYLYAAGSGTAVGYNFARNRDGDYARSGMSQDQGSFLGDASIGVAMRRGALQGSFGLVYREIEPRGLRAGHGVDTDVSEGLVGFQLSIKPD
jgi:hypothetical protein